MDPSARSKFLLLILAVLIGAGILGFAYDGMAKATDKVVQRRTIKPSKNPQNKVPKKLSQPFNSTQRALSKMTNYDLELSDKGYFVKPPESKKIYWFGPDKKIYSVPDHRILISWFGKSKVSLKEFSAHASSSKLIERYPKAGILFPRAGTYLIRFNGNPSVFALEPKGVLHPIENEAAALKFYGPLWNERIIVFEPNLQSYFTIGRLLVYDDYPPEGTLIKRLGSGNIYHAKWKQLTLITKSQWVSCNFLPQWVVEGEWDYPENPPYFYNEFLNCKPEDQMPKMVTRSNKLAQKDHLRILNTEFIESTEQLKPESYMYCYDRNRCHWEIKEEYAKRRCPACDIKPLRFFDVFNSEKKPFNVGTYEPFDNKEKKGFEPVTSIYEVKDWLERQYKENGRNLTVDFEVLGPLRLNNTYENVATWRRGNEELVAAALFQSGEGYLYDMGVKADDYDIINLLFYDSAGKFPALARSSAKKFNLIVIGDTIQRNPVKQSLRSIAHETLHVLGARDLHQNLLLCPIPDGLADPFKEPLYPQTKSVIMCPAAPKFVKGSFDSIGLENVVFGDSVIRDFGWK